MLGITVGLSGSRPAFSPVTVSGCTLWLPSDPGAMASNGTSWANMGSAGGSFTGTSTYVASGVNGRPTMRLNGTSNNFTSPGLASTLFTATNAFMFMAFKINAITLNNATPVYNNDALFSDAGADYGASLQGTANVLRAYNFSGTYQEPTSQSIAVGGTYVLTWKHTGGNISHQVNNGTAQSIASGATSSLASALQIGSSQSIRFASIDLMEVIGFNTALSADEEARVRTWLMARAGL